MTSREHPAVDPREPFRSAWDHAAVGMALIGADGTVVRANPALVEMTGFPETAIVGRSFDGLLHQDDVPAATEYRRRALGGEIGHYKHEGRLKRSDGTTIWARVNSSLLRAEDGEPVHFIAQIEDITDRKEVEERLLDHLLHDSLTGLHSRIRFMDRLSHALARSERNRTPVAVLFVDLDRFKDVNDRYGHRTGDKLLVAMAETLRRAVRPSDTVARFSGDEFAILCEDMSSERDAVLVAQRLCDASNKPVEIDGHLVSVTASIGIAFAQEGDDPDTLLKNADAAMYKVKEGGRGTYEIYLDAL